MKRNVSQVLKYSLSEAVSQDSVIRWQRDANATTIWCLRHDTGVPTCRRSTNVRCYSLFQYDPVTNCNMRYLNVHGTKPAVCCHVSYGTFSSTLSYPTHSILSWSFLTLDQFCHFLINQSHQIQCSLTLTTSVISVTRPHITQHSTVMPAIPPVPKVTHLWW